LSYRRQRAAQGVRERIAGILGSDVRDPRLQGVSVTAVEIAPDFSYARVFYRVLGDAEAAARALEQATGFIRRRLAEGIALRRVPELDFRLDESVDRGERIDQILRELDREREERDAEEEI
jgi:ribosome-binding factor A